MDAQGRIGSQDHLLLKRGLRKKEKGMIFLTVTSIFHCTQKSRKKISYALKEEESSKALKMVARGSRCSPELLILHKRGLRKKEKARKFDG
jgi:hypothetical protein